MASTINAITSGGGGIAVGGDTSGVIALQSNGTTFATGNQYGIGLGTAVPSSGIGLAFPATQSASSDANTLDDYEEGTWTPTLTFGGNSTGIAYSTRVGLYTKVGNIVTIAMEIQLSNKGSSTGSIWVTGLPFPYKSSIGGVYPMPCLIGSTTSQINPTAGVYLSNIYFYNTYSSGYTNTSDSAVSNATELTVCGSYITT